MTSEEVKRAARQLGFFACGIAKAAPVAEDDANAYRRWLERRGNAEMHYMEDHVEKRLDPTLLLPGAKSIVVVALNYTPTRKNDEKELCLAAYALGRDYHDVLKERLRLLAQTLRLPASNDDLKICTDTVPILERYWAVQAGLGFIGRNHQLIIPHAGSMFFLGEIVTTCEADQYDKPTSQSCGLCKRCVEQCPTGALGDPLLFDSEKCLSYQTIEHRGPLSDAAKSHLGNVIYGCDRCQQVCPWNKAAPPTDVADLQPSEALMQMRRDDWRRLTVEQYRALFKGSAVKRAKYEGLMRNIQAALAQESCNEQAGGQQEKPWAKP